MSSNGRKVLTLQSFGSIDHDQALHRKIDGSGFGSPVDERSSSTRTSLDTPVVVVRRSILRLDPWLDMNVAATAGSGSNEGSLSGNSSNNPSPREAVRRTLLRMHPRYGAFNIGGMSDDDNAAADATYEGEEHPAASDDPLLPISVLPAFSANNKAEYANNSAASAVAGCCEDVPVTVEEVLSSGLGVAEIDAARILLLPYVAALAHATAVPLLVLLYSICAYASWALLPASAVNGRRRRSVGGQAELVSSTITTTEPVAQWLWSGGSALLKLEVAATPLPLMICLALCADVLLPSLQPGQLYTGIALATLVLTLASLFVSDRTPAALTLLRKALNAAVLLLLLASCLFTAPCFAAHRLAPHTHPSSPEKEESPPWSREALAAAFGLALFAVQRTEGVATHQSSSSAATEVGGGRSAVRGALTHLLSLAVLLLVCGAGFAVYGEALVEDALLLASCSASSRPAAQDLPLTLLAMLLLAAALLLLASLVIATRNASRLLLSCNTGRPAAACLSVAATTIAAYCLRQHLLLVCALLGSSLTAWRAVLLPCILHMRTASTGKLAAALSAAVLISVAAAAALATAVTLRSGLPLLASSSGSAVRAGADSATATLAPLLGELFLHRYSASSSTIVTDTAS